MLVEVIFDQVLEPHIVYVHPFPTRKLPASPLHPLSKLTPQQHMQYEHSISMKFGASFYQGELLLTAGVWGMSRTQAILY